MDSDEEDGGWKEGGVETEVDVGGRRCGAALSGWHAGRRGAEATGRVGEEVDGWNGRWKEGWRGEWRD